MALIITKYQQSQAANGEVILALDFRIFSKAIINKTENIAGRIIQKIFLFFSNFTGTVSPICTYPA